MSITTPVVMNPPTAVGALTVAPHGQLSFSGTATDDEGLANVEVSFRNSTTGESLAADGTWAVQSSGWFRVTAIDVSGSSTPWSYATSTTPGFDLTPGTYSLLGASHR